MRFLEFLLQQGYIQRGNETAASMLSSEQDADIADVEKLLNEEGVTDDKILEYKQAFFNLPGDSVEGNMPPFEVLKAIPQESVTFYKFVPIRIANGILEVGMVDPDSMEARDALQFIATKINMPVKIHVITTAGFERIAGGYKGLGGEVSEALTEFGSEETLGKKDVLGDVWGADIEDISEKGPGGETTITENAPVTKIVAVILRHAIEGNASDVHIENERKNVRVRFRVDGELYTSLLLPPSVHNALVSRIKILARLKLDEKRKPQDGRFSASIAEKKIDFRVSTMPAYYGEKVVMRILDPTKGVKTLEDLGVRKDIAETIRAAIKKPYGMILVTGPTGSGKTTTLYSMISEIDKEKKNVISLEDPVEYNIPGMSQSQIRPEIGYSFATGLRSILRQDPDIIMVGEIRDKETAQLAVQAALTGHLVFSTLHTNNSIGVIPRLIDMGVDPFLIAPTLELALAQRLVRVMCPGAGEEVPVEGAVKALIDKQFADLPDEFKKKLPLGKSVFKAHPTKECPSGTQGRIAVMEALPIDNALERIILEDPVEPKIWNVARKNGMLTLREDAILKSVEGVVSFEEASVV
ncbi:GspE/PulE family protein [bacterium]|nr:GspE/PulE family protein [bacterium]MCI0565657.1 GspE/PulE family protein [bacterium]MCI0679955.1 GspE/PulE family protein [bacterium]